MFETLKYNFIAGVFRKAPFVLGRKLTESEINSGFPDNTIVVAVNAADNSVGRINVVKFGSRPLFGQEFRIVESISGKDFLNLLLLKKFLLQYFSEYIFKECSKANSFARILVRPSAILKRNLYYTTDLKPVFPLKLYKNGKCKVRTTDFKFFYVMKDSLYTTQTIYF